MSKMQWLQLQQVLWERRRAHAMAHFARLETRAEMLRGRRKSLLEGSSTGTRACHMRPVGVNEQRFILYLGRCVHVAVQCAMLYYVLCAHQGG
jgi:hypothetical protein